MSNDMGPLRRQELSLREQSLAPTYDFVSASPRKRHARAAVPVVMNDTRVRFLLEASVALTKRPQTDADWLGRVNLRVLKRWQELNATPIHGSDRLLVVQPYV